MSNEQGWRRKRRKRPWSHCSIQKKGISHRGREDHAEEQAKSSSSITKSTCEHSPSFLTGISSKIVGVVLCNQRRNVCIDLGFDPNCIELSRNLPVTAARLGPGLQRLSVYSSTCKHESTCPEEHFTFLFTPIHFSYRDSFWWVS